jgi:pyruvate/2-oxoglutarate dehydrogenase complex dihydrolipoamide acyltransferase (E2) component
VEEDGPKTISEGSTPNAIAQAKVEEQATTQKQQQPTPPAAAAAAASTEAQTTAIPPPLKTDVEEDVLKTISKGATPTAKALAKKNKLDISCIEGTGNFGRVTVEDVKAVLGNLAAVAAGTEPQTTASPPPVKKDVEEDGPKTISEGSTPNAIAQAKVEEQATTQEQQPPLQQSLLGRMHNMLRGLPP